MGNTIIQNVAKVKDGQLLFESFESENFTTQQAWTLLNGVPTTSTFTSEIGTRSFILDGTFPLLEKSFPAPGPTFNWSVGYFSDDTTITAGGYEPFIRWELTSGGGEWGLGVDNAVSTVFYTRILNGVKSASPIARADGFRQFVFHHDGVDVNLYVDGVLAGSAVPGGGTDFRFIEIGEISGAGSPSFGYIDNVQVCLNREIKFKNLTDGQVVTIFNEDNALIGTETAAGGVANVSVGFTDSPFQGYYKISREDGVGAFIYSATQSLAAGDLFFVEIIDFGRRATTFAPVPSTNRTDKEANFPITETIWFNTRDQVQFSVNQLVHEQQKQLLRWWSQASRSIAYGVAIDSDNTINARVTVDVEDNAESVTVDDVGGIGRGATLILRRPDNFHQEYVEVASVAGLVVTLTGPTMYEYPAGSFVRSEFFWPQALSNDRALGISLSNIKVKRWNFSHSFKEDF